MATDVLFLLGPPGSGKGTQAKMLAKEKTGYIHVSTGDLFRKEIASQSELGLSVEETIRLGNLVSDDVTNKVFHSQMQILNKNHPEARLYILDGYPRTAPQAEFLRDLTSTAESAFFPLHIAELDVPEDEVVERISGRLVNPRNGLVYHRTQKAPKIEGICDEDGGALVQRDDDKPETVRDRYQIYRREVDGIVTLLGGAERIVRINGSDKPSKVYENLKLELEKLLENRG